jgi:hypothetical protein
LRRCCGVLRGGCILRLADELRWLLVGLLLILLRRVLLLLRRHLSIDAGLLAFVLRRKLLLRRLLWLRVGRRWLSFAPLLQSEKETTNEIRGEMNKSREETTRAEQKTNESSESEGANERPIALLSER